MTPSTSAPASGVIMGIVNVTDDSFSDGGEFLNIDSAVQHAFQLLEDGAHIIDVGGESTRPGATRVPEHVEQERVLPVVAELSRSSVSVSIDTLNASTARAAVEAGATFVNDVSGGLADSSMAATIAQSGARYIVGHWRGTPQTMTDLAHYDDVVKEVQLELGQRIDDALDAGVQHSQLLVDPGLGFAKTPDHNWTLLAHLPEISGLGFPVLIGASRKRFIGELLSAEASMTDRDVPSAVVAALAVQAGAWGVRVHDVRVTKSALAVCAAWKAAE